MIGSRRAWSRKVDNFDLLIEKAGAGYRARVQNPESGEVARKEFSHPFSLEGLEDALEPREDCRDLKGTRTEDHDFNRKIGSSLFQRVFADEILDFWRMRLREAQKTGKDLRLRLRLGEPELWDWPWELLCDPEGRFLAALPETPVVRYIESAVPIRRLRVRPPIRVLAIAASPLELSALSLREELESLEGILKDLSEAGWVEFDAIEGVTRDALRQKLDEKSFHVLHFTGHGSFDETRSEGVILLEDGQSRADPVGAQDLSLLLRAHPEIRLVVLNVCRGAQGSGSDPFAGLAQSLIRDRLPAVVAMRSAVTDRAALLFSRYFYSSLSKREPIDRAISKARHAMLTEGTAEWSSPILVTRSPSCRIIDPTWREILLDNVYRVLETWRYWIVAFVLLLLLALTFQFLGRRWIDPNLIWTFSNPSDCPSPPGLSIAFIKVEPPSPSRPFCIGRFEITRRLWKKVVGKPPTRDRGDALPVVKISWEDTGRFLAALTKREPGGRFRLPTGVEWELAARAGEDVARLASAETANCENKQENDGFEGAAPVGSYPPNAFGLRDMLGNASEWVSDESPDGRRVRRGGGFKNVVKNCSAKYASRMKPDSHPEDAGFRIVRDPVEDQGPKGHQGRQGHQGRH